MDIFSFNPSFWHWLGLAFLLLALEIVAPVTFFLWLCLAAVCSAVVKLAVPDISLAMQLFLFALFCIFSLIAWRRFGIDGRETKTDQPALNQRNQRYLGRIVELSKPIENGIGKVTIEDSQWKVTGPDLAAGNKVRVVEVDGSIFKVEAV